MPDALWSRVDEYIEATVLPRDPALAATLRRNQNAGLPPIDVSPAQGQLLHLLAQMAGARRILEIGTLGGYSTICLARALPDDGRLVTIERDPRHAEVARENLAEAGVLPRVDLRVGAALEILPALVVASADPFDFVFIDADKANNEAYLDWGVRLGRSGTVIVVDNVVRDGAILEAESDDPAIVGTRAAIAAATQRHRLRATVIQTVGVKGHDGFLLAVVD